MVIMSILHFAPTYSVHFKIVMHVLHLRLPHIMCIRVGIAFSSHIQCASLNCYANIAFFPHILCAYLNYYVGITCRAPTYSVD
jgi:hypothetical protein